MRDQTTTRTRFSVIRQNSATSPVCPESAESNEAGFLLLGVIVLVALILLVLSLAAPKVALELKREREVEAEHRANEYVRALRLYYTQLSSYPASLDQLEKTNNIRFLRQRYADPFTGKADWRLIPVGQNKTTVKGFFGQPLSGLGGGGLGSASGIASPGQPGAIAGAGFGATPPGATGGGFGGTSGFGSSNAGSSFGSSSFGSDGSGSSSQGSSGPQGSPGTTSSSSSSSGFGSGTNLGTPFMGIGLVKDQTSMVEYNGEKNYSTWEFLYDPRIEQMYAKASIFGGGIASTNAGSLGSASGLSSGFGAGTPGNGAPGSAGGSNSGFGSSSFGSGSGFGSSGNNGPGNGTGSTPPASPQPQ